MSDARLSRVLLVTLVALLAVMQSVVGRDGQAAGAAGSSAATGRTNWGSRIGDSTGAGVELAQLVRAQTGTYLRVPQDFATIQAAIDAATTGDVVLVSPGTYRETLTISSKVITLASEFLTTADRGRIDSTIIQGTGSNHGATFQPSAAGSTLQGFTLLNAASPNGLYDGVRAGGTLQILDNRISGWDDGVDFEPPSKVIGTCICKRNIIENGSDDGIDLDNSSEGQIEDNILRNNYEDGIEIRFYDEARPLNIVIRGNTITGNRQDGVQLIDLTGASERHVRLEGNVIASNGKVGLGLMDNANSGEDYRAASLLDPIRVVGNTFVSNDHHISGGDNLVAVNNLFVGASRIGLKGVDGNSIAAYSLFWANGRMRREAKSTRPPR